ncbi:YqjF family protein [Natrialbaceae archaeon AArc-T1-2]|uniref:YqjF family protein n=1 Tax=Natrialbaceae archaeon AArc-T1-2 TaxID=3053904 RepID=UPI00255AE04A|nr:DUF2071 domain-containing protein [Natrialbaceae archaeon AArc-T1-2]WIV68329.1 DUF2071 domain-containing protein [Natrialbaceae archaeon AArc-T1-2]
MLPIAMGWRRLLFANWPLEPEAVDARLPDALAADTHEGRAWLSIVPFRNVDVRPRGLPAWLGLDLPELNLRTYVRCDGEPGVYFFSLDAEGIAGVLGARVTHYLPYYYARIGMRERNDVVRFRTVRRHPGARPVLFDASYEPVGESFTPAPGSLAAFLTERYRYYSQDASGQVRYADVDHEPWTLQAATVTLEENTLFEANGFDEPAGSPVCYYSRGLDVTASRNRPFR